MREIIRTWPEAPSGQEDKTIRRILLTQWQDGFAKDWTSMIGSSHYLPYWPDVDIPDQTAIIAQLNAQQALTLFDGSLLLGACLPPPAYILYLSPGRFSNAILHGQIDPRRPSDSKPFSTLTDSEELPNPSWLWTREEIEHYAVSQYRRSTYGPTAEEQTNESGKPWPYSHDTELLGHLRWTIETYWEGKDPKQAPTKETVVEKLMELRGVSKRAANAIDQIARHDARR
ncbi:MAG: hypothetical protein JZU52_17660 [Lamprocystis purpurea]|nr:hypothetical protein [Lamprocystis purpurea]